MIDPKNKIADVNQYITGFPAHTQKMLKQMRAAVRKAAPGAEESISYQMPYYKYQGRLLYFAAFKNHIGFYPMASGIAKFKKEIATFKNAKGSVQFPLDEPLPVELIRRMVAFRVKENSEKAAVKAEKK